jgi:hypothetical protein
MKRQKNTLYTDNLMVMYPGSMGVRSMVGRPAWIVPYHSRSVPRRIPAFIRAADLREVKRSK